MKKLLLVLFLSICVLFLKAQSSGLAFQSGETLQYTGYYNIGFIWVKAAKVSFRTTLDSDNYSVYSTCASAKAWDWFFKVRDTMSVTGTRCNFLPSKFERVVHEGGYLAHFDYKFDYDKAKITSNGFKRKDIFVNKEIKLDTPAIDVITFSLSIRNIDFNKYRVGDKIPVRLIISNEIYNLYIRYKGIENVKLKSGERIECYKIAPMLIKGNTFSGGESMMVWISKDKNRVPVMATAEVVVGSIKAILASYENIRYTSKIFPQTSGVMGKQPSDS